MSAPMSRPTFRRRGVAGALYSAIFDILLQQGYYRVHAGITLPNQASVGLHEQMGFKLVGLYEKVGYKLGAWHDVAWYQRPLQPSGLNPGEPVALTKVFGKPEWQISLLRGLARYKTT